MRVFKPESGQEILDEFTSHAASDARTDHRDGGGSEDSKVTLHCASQASGIYTIVLVLMHTALGATQGPATTQMLPAPNLEDLYEKALRDFPQFVNERRTRFVAVGFDQAEDPLDPTEQFLTRFADFDGAIKPASKARRIGRIRDDTGALGFWHFQDPETGKRTRIYYVIVRDRHADDEVRIWVGYVTAPLDAGAREAIYRFDDGVWTLDRVVRDFIP